MNWTLIPLPAAEELAGGYVPTPHLGEPEPSAFSLRRFLTMVFAVFGLATGLQHAAAAQDEVGHRRLTEISIGERKSPCRDCAQIERRGAGQPDSGAPDVLSES